MADQKSSNAASSCPQRPPSRASGWAMVRDPQNNNELSSNKPTFNEPILDSTEQKLPDKFPLLSQILETNKIPEDNQHTDFIKEIKDALEKPKDDAEELARKQCTIEKLKRKLEIEEKYQSDELDT